MVLHVKPLHFSFFFHPNAAAAFTWMMIEWCGKGKPTAVGIATGAVAGLVAITPASG